MPIATSAEIHPDLQHLTSLWDPPREPIDLSLFDGYTPPENTDGNDLLQEHGKHTVKSDAKFGFSRTLAKDAGLLGAMVLRFLAYKCRCSRNLQKELRWFYETIPALAVRFPRTSSRLMEKTLNRLAKAGLLIRDRFNRLRADRTWWYSVPDEVAERAEKDLIYFRLDDAMQFGLLEALLLNNLTHRNPRQGSESGDWHCLRPKWLADYYCFTSVSSIQRALGNLIKQKVVMTRWCGKQRAREYMLMPAFLDRVRPQSIQFSGEPDKPTVLGEASEITLPVARAEAQIAQPQGDTKTRLVFKAAEEILADISADNLDGYLDYVKAQAAHFLSGLSDETLVLRYKGAGSLDELLIRIVAGWNLDPNEPRAVFWQMALSACAYKKVEVLIRTEVRRRAYQLSLNVHRRFQEWFQMDRRRQYEERQLELRNVDYEQETMVDQPAATKARILRNGLSAKNRIGILNEWLKLKTDYLKFTPRDIRAAEIFFSANRAWSPRNILDVMDACAKVPEAEDDAKDPHFHARRATELRFLLTYLEPVLQQLGCSAWMPEVAFLTREDLYPHKPKSGVGKKTPTE